MSSQRTDVALLTALVPYLTDNVVSVRETAEHFDVSPERIRDAVRLLFTTGVPSGWGDANMFDFDWDAFEQDDEIVLQYLPALEGTAVRLARGEAGAIVAGLRLLGSVAGADRDAIDALSAKIARASSPEPANLAVDTTRAHALVARVRDAIEHREVLTLRYRKPGEAATERVVAPLQLEWRGGELFLSAYDFARDARRTFRLDRILEATTSAEAWPVSLGSPTRLAGHETITVIATPAAAVALADYARVSEAEGERVRLLIDVWDSGSVLHAILAVGGDARVIAPEHARLQVREMAIAALRGYETAHDL